MKALWVGVVGLILAASASAKKAEPITVSVKAPVDKVKAAAVQEAVAEGYRIEQDGEFQMVFTKTMDGKAGFFTSALLSPPACSSIQPRWLLTVLFVPNQDAIAVESHSEYEHAGPLCRPVRQELDGKNVRQFTENFLGKVKSRSEQASAPALSEAQKEIILANSEAAKDSPAARAANGDHVPTPEELAALVKEGKASKCAVVTVPSGADIYIDGNKMTVTPAVFVLLKKDAPRKITVKKDGYKTVEKEYDPDGKVIPIDLTLEKQ